MRRYRQIRVVSESKNLMEVCLMAGEGRMDIEIIYCVP